jgi:hypothetical protein
MGGDRLDGRPVNYVRLSKGQAAVFFFALGLSSCGYLVHGKTEKITVTSEPSGATVAVNEGQTGITPFSVRVWRADDLVFHFSKSGYRSLDVADPSEVWEHPPGSPPDPSWVVGGPGDPSAAAVAGNFIGTAAFLGAYMIDYRTGADSAHHTTKVNAQLEPLALGSTNSGVSSSSAPLTNLPSP